MDKNILCIDPHGMVTLEMAISLKQLGLDQIAVNNLQEAGYLLNSDNIPISLLVFVAESFENFNISAMKAFAESVRVIKLPVLILCPVYDKKLKNAVVEAGFGPPSALPFNAGEFQKRVCRLLGIEPRGYIPALENDMVAFSFEEMLSRELKSAARGHYSFALLMLSISAVNEGETEHELVELLKCVLKIYLRETDTVFLAGINGIVAILPFADREGAQSVADKAKELLRNHSELSKLSDGFAMESCSVLYPDDAKTKVKLLEHLKTFSTKHLKI